MRRGNGPAFCRHLRDHHVGAAVPREHRRSLADKALAEHEHGVATREPRLVNCVESNRGGHEQRRHVVRIVLLYRIGQLEVGDKICAMGPVAETRDRLAKREPLAFLALAERDDVADPLVAGGERHGTPGGSLSGGG